MITKEKIEEAADEYVFVTMGHRFSNNDGSAGDNYASFIAGANYVIEFIEQQKLSKEEKWFKEFMKDMVLIKKNDGK